MTVLELATDLDLPRGGDAWHQLRNGQLPDRIISSLSKELLEIIRLMIERDHVKRATVDQLLQNPSVQAVMRARTRKYAWASVLANGKRLAHQFNMMMQTLWFFIMRPLDLAKSFAGKTMSFMYGQPAAAIELNGQRRLSENGGRIIAQDSEQNLRHTSTPKRDNCGNAPVVTMDEDEEAHSKCDLDPLTLTL